MISEVLTRNLSESATAFLCRSASFVEAAIADPGPDVRTAARGMFGEFRATQCLKLLEHLQAELAGLTYFSASWSFEEKVTFWPELDLDPDDEFPAISLLEHSVAQPFGVWVDEQGKVQFMFPGEHEGKYLPVFPSVHHMIESDALHAECKSSDWVLDAGGGAADIADAAAYCESLGKISHASGYTEQWWGSASSRVFIWRTFSELFQDEHAVRWALWERRQ
ncbi:hypothetical protein [Streptomyces sp. JJ36]|uniref:hypothetical protein n=1 Tax=Streptomyces sp. JJ36 TaxID=2736645 RepID=UPI001F36C6FF|nr:hypothetical protein [Streptomyces sp. JJ36]MCF6524442.1 hypothetical protein [Streptomyces sp. JJ36]